MTARVRRFRDRDDAGQQLARALESYVQHADVIVLGLPRGGVPVAAQVARFLRAPLDVLIVRKLGAPGWEELAMGAIASPGIRILNEDVVDHLGISQAQIREVTDREQAELRRREIVYRGRTGAPDVRGRTVILVDDGIATGATVHSALLALREQHPSRMVLAVPLSSEEALDRLRPLVDELVVLSVPEPFGAVGTWYDHFPATSDEEVQRLLVEAGNHRPPLIRPDRTPSQRGHESMKSMPT